MQTLLLDTVAWDLVLDVHNDIAVASEPYALSQDAASAIKVFKGEAYWDTELGIPYLADILGKNPPTALLKATFVEEAKTVPGVAAAQCFLAELTDRILSGQIQVTAEETGAVSAANFAVTNPQGG